MQHAALPAAPLAALATLDVEAGIARLMGQRTVYLQALARFRDEQATAAQTIERAVRDGNMALAQRLLHTLKGAAGMIDAHALQASALALESALRTAALPDAALTRLGADLRTLLGLLASEAFQQETSLETASVPALAPDAAPFDALRALLDLGDGAALDLVVAARTGLQMRYGERHYASLAAAVAGFDFEGALLLLDALEQQTA
jgi:HPt (histidine-containing phosphotransfer) domain-containing protein